MKYSLIILVVAFGLSHVDSFPTEPSKDAMDDAKRAIEAVIEKIITPAPTVLDRVLNDGIKVATELSSPSPALDTVLAKVTDLIEKLSQNQKASNSQVAVNIQMNAGNDRSNSLSDSKQSSGPINSVVFNIDLAKETSEEEPEPKQNVVFFSAPHSESDERVALETVSDDQSYPDISIPNIIPAGHLPGYYP